MSETAASLDALAARMANAEPPEGAGILAAGTVALAAGMCEAIARAALADWPEARGIAVQALVLRERAGQAGATNAAAYARARVALHDPASAGTTGRDAMLRAALIAAAQSLLTVAAVACDCATLAAETAAGCAPALRADAAGVAELGAAGARAAAGLVEINLALRPEDELRTRARELVAAAETACTRAREAVSDQLV